jgi:glycolate oxidase
MNKSLRNRLIKIVGKEHVLSTPEDLAAYGYDATFEEGLPEVVVLPDSTEQVSEVLRLAHELKLPVITRGMGSGLAAGAVPVQSGLVLALTRMNRILEIDEENAIVRVQAGVVTADLQTAVERVGLFYPPDPGSVRHSTIGGNIACNSGGPRCLKYGVTRDYVLGLTVVLADGRVLRTGGKTIKDVTGYDLVGLFTGSEGTLGVVTEALLRLIAYPKQSRTAMAEFDDLDKASETVTAILQAGIVPVALELMDRTALACVEAAYHLGLNTDVEASLLIQTDGSDAEAVTREIEACAGICRQNGSIKVHLSEDPGDQAMLWVARQSMLSAQGRLAPNMLVEDITVPRNKIPEAVRRLRAISEQYGLPVSIFGHAGDGNLHPNILFDKRDPDQWATVQEMAAAIFALALELGGTLSGEHGIGLLKKAYLEDALGEVSVEVQRRIKAALDPAGILNPGKVL